MLAGLREQSWDSGKEQQDATITPKDIGTGDPRKESEKECIYIRVTLLYTRNYKSTILQFGKKKEETPQPLSPLAPQSPAGASH